MSQRRILAWVAVFVTAGLALLGFLVFLVGVVIEFVNTRTTPPDVALSPTIQVALAGLFLSALMMTFVFILVMLLLARQTRQQAPGYGDAYRFMQQYQFARAIPVLERAVNLGRETSEVLGMLTSAYAYTGQLAKAQSTADRAVQMFPQDPGAYVALAHGYRLQASYDEAARALQVAAGLAPKQPIIWAELGFIQQLAGKTSDAFESFQQAARDPMPAMYSVRVYHHLAEAHKTAGDAEEAVRATAKMMSARQGLEPWRPLQVAMEGTAYGQALRYEIANIEEAIAEADSASLE